MPLTATLYVVGPRVTATLLLPLAVPPNVKPPLLQPLPTPRTTAVKLMGEALVGSACPAAWLIVPVGAEESNVTVLSVLVEAVLPLPAPSWAIPAAIVAINVPSVMPLTATL